MPAIYGLMIALAADLTHWFAGRVPLALLVLCSIVAATLTRETATTAATTATIATTPTIFSPTTRCRVGRGLIVALVVLLERLKS
jgi:hypothetical protein